MPKPLFAAGITVTASLPGHVFIEFRDHANVLIAVGRLAVEHADLLIGQIELARDDIEGGKARPTGVVH
jgi:hypothetical protein